MKVRKKSFLCCILIVAIILSSVGLQVLTFADGETGDTSVFTEKIEYGDFEGTYDQLSAHWTVNGSFEFTDEENHTEGGSKCLVVRPNGSAWQILAYIDSNQEAGVAIIPGAKYRLSFWHKGAANGQLEVGDWGIPEGKIPGYSENGVADEDWTYYYKDYSANARTRIDPLCIKNTVDGATAGEASYFDDIKIEMIEAPRTPKPVEPLTEDETLAGKHETMEMGTNFWFTYSWSGWTPIKENVNWETAYENGDNIWNETFIKEIEPFTTLRFMDWNHTNHSRIVEWSERRLPTDPGNACPDEDSDNASGLAYEWMIDLCNRYDKNPWICVPSSASDDYLRKLATLCKEKLEPGRKLYIEYSNEVWNYGFQQYSYCEEMGKKTTEIGLTEETKFTDNYNANYYVYRSFQMFNIFEEVYGYEEMGKSCIRICATSANMYLFDVAYENVFYSKIYNPLDQRADYLAVAPYVGLGLDGYDVDIRISFHDAIDEILDSYVKYAYNMGKKYGLPLVAYEGGQHLLLGADAWSSNPDIYNQYIYMLNQYAPYFELFCHYCLTGSWGSGGAWGANAYTGQPLEDAHKLRALYDWIDAPTVPYEGVSFPEGAPGNASFQNGLEGWTTNAKDGTYEVVTNSTAEEDAGHPHYLSFRCTDNDNNGKYFETAFRLEPGETYRMEYDLGCYNTKKPTEACLISVSVLDYETNEGIGGRNWTGPFWSTETPDPFTVPADGNGMVKIRFAVSSWDPSGVCNLQGKIDNFKIYKVGEEKPSDPQEPSGTYIYERKPLEKITPMPRVTPTPTATPTPTSTVTPTQQPTADDMPKDTPVATGLPVDIVPTTTPGTHSTPGTTTKPSVTAVPTASATTTPDVTPKPIVKKVQKVKFVKKSIKVKKGKKVALKVKLTPAKGLTKAAKKVKWSINKKGKKVIKFVKKAKKLRGKFKVKIKAKKRGKAKVTCKAPSGKKAVCKVKVK